MFLTFCFEWEVHIKHGCCIPKYDCCLKEKHLFNHWNESWPWCFTHGILMSKKTNFAYSDLHIFWQIFSKKWTKWSCLTGNICEIFLDNDKIHALFQNLEFWKTWIYSHELDRLLMRSMVILNMWMCQHLEDLPISVNQYFPNDQSMVLQNYAWIKGPFEVKINQ